MRVSRPARVALVAVTLGFTMFVSSCDSCRMHTYPSSSMEPTIHKDDVVFVTYFSDDSQRSAVVRGDVVVYEVPGSDNPPYLKRVVALGGDTVELRNARLLINGAPIEEPYASYSGQASTSFGPVTVPEDHVFIMGDNRDMSIDSRDHGSIHKSHLLGKLVW